MWTRAVDEAAVHQHATAEFRVQLYDISRKIPAEFPLINLAS
jgi:hypothetical protein